MALFSLRMPKRFPVVLIGIIVMFLAWEVVREIYQALEQGNFRDKTRVILIRGGCFTMGDLAGTGNRDERPVHINCVDPFYLGRTEVTVEEFSKFIHETRYRTSAEREAPCISRGKGAGRTVSGLNWRTAELSGMAHSPVICVSWNDTAEYVRWLKNESPGRAMEYRLPTETEWEFAARERGTGIHFVRGDRIPGGKVGPGNSGPVPVAKHLPNGLGLFDMEGNVSEWVYDRYRSDWYQEGEKTNTKGPSEGNARVYRGGSWATIQEETRASARWNLKPDQSADDLGFRVALPLAER